MKISKIGKNLVVAFLLATSLASIAGILLIVSMKKLDTEYSDALYNYAFAKSDLAQLSAQVKASGLHMKDVVFLDSADQIAKARTQAQTSMQEIDKIMVKVRPTVQSDKAKEMFVPIEKGIIDYFSSANSIIAHAAGGNLGQARSIWLSQSSSIFTALDKSVEETLSFAGSGGEEVSIQLQKDAKNSIIFGIVVVGLGIVCSVSIALRTSKSFSNPITLIEEAASKMAQGNFDARVSYDKDDELGDLVKSMGTMITSINHIITDTSKQLGEIANGNFNIQSEAEYVGIFKEIETSITKITDNLSHTMEQVVLSSDQVTGGSEQVSNAAQSLAQGATEQASSVQQLSASINEISDQVKSNADNAKYANDLAYQVSENITSSNEQMGHLMSAMEDINHSSIEIGKIIKAIEDLAFQTNILALNAAVEAARAGSAGKGFAVVADEVRNLASKSSEAAKQTNELIENSTKSVANGSKIATDTATSLSQVVEGAGEITTLINKIAEASLDQSTSISQINLGVEQVSAVVQTNSATSEESAASSEELSSQANMLKDLVSRFKLKSSSNSQRTQIQDGYGSTESYSNAGYYGEDLKNDKY